MSTTPAKDTIYIDVEDEITAIIDKLHHSESKIVALVLPKRATALQSIVNLKLLNRTAENANKNLVLITSDPNILPLAGAVGLHVAKTPQSKPSVPVVPKATDQAITVESDTELDAPDDVELDSAAPIGQLAGIDDDTIEVDNETPVVDKQASKKSKANKAGSKLRIPNFEKFRTRLFLGGGALVLLIIGWILAAIVLPKASIIIKTDTSVVNTTLNLTGQTNADKADVDKLLVPIIKKELKKTDTEKVAATGERDDGKKATGKMTLKNCIFDGQPYTIPAGTGFTSNGLTFITNATIALDPAVYAGPGNCISSSKEVGVTAAAAGDKYNLDSRAYGVPAAYDKGSQGSIEASGSAMSGGTTKITKVVSQDNIDSAKQAVLDKVKKEALAELSEKMTADQTLAIADTFTEGTPTVSADPKLNEPASEVSVDVTVTYSQLAVKKADLTPIVEADVQKHIDTSKQVIQNTGLDEAVLRITSKPSKSEYKLEVETVATAGPQLDAEGIKKEIAGKKKGQTKDIVLARPGVQDVEIHYSPFWIFSTPSRTSRINIVFDQNNADTSN